MPQVKLSIYSSLFNVKSNKFDYKDFIAHVAAFADEVIISTIKDSDNSAKLLKSAAKKFPNVEILLTELTPDKPTFDGALKDAALQKCSGNILLQLDGDERLGITDRAAWEYYLQLLLESSSFSCIMLPSINLYKDDEHFSDITYKWYLHKRGLKRGVVDFAKRPDGTHKIHGDGASDSCELLDENNRLVKSVQIVPNNNMALMDWWKIQDSQSPFIVHHGYKDLDRRAEINKNFWSKMWEIEDGRPVNLPISAEEIRKPWLPLGRKL